MSTAMVFPCAMPPTPGEPACTREAKTICIRCGKIFCDGHMDGRVFQDISIKDNFVHRGYLCLLCVTDDDKPVPEDSLMGVEGGVAEDDLPRFDDESLRRAHLALKLPPLKQMRNPKK